VNTENSDFESTPPEKKTGEDLGAKAIDGPGKPSEPPGPEPAAHREKKKGGGGLAFLALVFSLAALGITGWNWWQGQSSGNEEAARVYNEISRLESSDSELGLKIKQLRDELDTLASGDVGAEFEALQKRLESDRRAMTDIEQSMQEQLALSRSLQAAADSMQGRLQAAEAAVTGLSTMELDAGGELDLAEVDYLLRLANERLKLFNDAEAADEALQVADMHLAALDNPMYLGVRQDIAAARRELSSVEMPNYLDIAHRLDAIQEAVPSLLFIEDELPVAEPVDDPGEGWWDKTMSTFASLVTVRRSTDQENERISLEDKDYIRQRLWLQLEIAHLALMRHDQAAFRRSLERVGETLTSWFRDDTDAFEEVSSGIDELQSIDIEVDVPDITAPWNTLRLLRNTALPAAVPEAAAETADGPAESQDEDGQG
jgi:uroporphyrin-3 C-methyltransferase